MIESTIRDRVTGISAVALHEAAHALAALGHGIGVLYVNRSEVGLKSPGDFLERGRHHGAIATAYAITALAGHAAAPQTGLSKSDELLLEHAFFLGSWTDPPDEMRRAFSVLAERFVLEHREEIENLAIALDQRRSLSGTELEEILGSVGK
ncbi:MULTISPECIES: hypothetical protein [Rhizobium]|uniref:hypothetical protein n=1 Tax=Rhizobium TaxID=379 RepID=UPI001031D9C9|nr:MULTISPECIES: hypothetical protein [Rhizobium]MBY5483250.1 hypothetical protein [Rhizobium leguminosarum]NEI28470.1 hypothetical protein [Rhizobium ruizarguesonis]NKL64993.1 hypothetical protein [Rhizobium leguminosarum bv. viciae]TBA81187.1 hypothetical protein ELH56_13535 [Rhizobium ruizarguesonis]TBZ64515.1 hypothetical protein E0H43_32855 [Rhizobium leguminosarum bv. viciae]